jgi:hypothetical protein
VFCSTGEWQFQENIPSRICGQMEISSTKCKCVNTISKGTNFRKQCLQSLNRMTDNSLIHSLSWDLLKKPPIVQLLKNFAPFYGTRRFITVFTRAIHWSLTWAKSIQSIPSHPISLRSILMSSAHLHLCIPSGLFRPGFPTISYMHSSSPPFVLHDLPTSSSLTWSS